MHPTTNSNSSSSNSSKYQQHSHSKGQKHGNSLLGLALDTFEISKHCRSARVLDMQFRFHA
jgi:hypothetical protein